MIQSKVDRRLFYDHVDEGKLFLVAVYVDDSWYISTSALLEKNFVTKLLNTLLLLILLLLRVSSVA